MTISPYPLLWPDRHPRTPKERRRYSAFKCSLETAAKECAAELRRFGATDITITSNIKADLAGGGGLVGTDAGVAIWFTLRKTQRCFACDMYTDVRSNIRAIGLSVEGLRTVERHNAQMLEQLMSANTFDALPAQAGDGIKMYFAGCENSAEVEKRYRELVQIHHPDRGGDDATMAEINRQKRELIL